MLVSLDIIGNGTVKGGGVHPTGAPVTLTANPLEGWAFGKYIIDDKFIVDNPYTFNAPDHDVIIGVVFYVTVREYLRGLVDNNIPDRTLVSMGIDRNIDMNADSTILTQQQKDLLYADLLIWKTTSLTSYQGEIDSDGGWSHQGERTSLSDQDRKYLERQAMSIYRRYNDAKARIGSTIRIINLW